MINNPYLLLPICYSWIRSRQDYDGEPAVRILNPCKNGDSEDSCIWFDNSTTLLKRRWYSTAEALGNGTIAIVGGFVNGGYINRNYPNTDPETEGGAAEPTWELYPPTPGWVPPVVNFVVKTSGLNSYPHLFLMPSGKIFAQANYSTSELLIRNGGMLPRSKYTFSALGS